MDGVVQRQWCLGKFPGRSQDDYNRDGLCNHSILQMWKPRILAIWCWCFGCRPLKTPCSFENESIDLHSPDWTLQWLIQWRVFQFLCQSKRRFPAAIANNWREEKDAKMEIIYFRFGKMASNWSPSCTIVPPLKYNWDSSRVQHTSTAATCSLQFNPLPTYSTIVGVNSDSLHYPFQSLPTTTDLRLRDKFSDQFQPSPNITVYKLL